MSSVLDVNEAFCGFLGNSRASDHAPGGGAVGGGPHLHRGLPANLQDLPVQSHGRWQETAGLVPGGLLPGHGQLGLFCSKMSVLGRRLTKTVFG